MDSNKKIMIYMGIAVTVSVIAYFFYKKNKETLKNNELGFSITFP